MEPIRTFRSGLRSLVRNPRSSVVSASALVLVVIIAGACAAGGATSFPGGASGAPAAGGGPTRDVLAPQSGGETGGGKGGVDQPGVPNPAAPRDGALVVKTGTVQLEVKDLTVLVKARTAIVGLGGYVSGSQQATGGEHKVASVTYRIPAARWDEALDALKALATKVVSEQTQAVEVTGQVLDLGARIENLRASERALQAIMSRATRIPDVLEVQARLSDVRGQIEQLATQKAHLEDEAAFGTVSVTFDVPVVPVQEVSQKWDLKAEVDRAMAQLIGLGQGVATLAIWFAIVLLPVLLAAGIAIGIALVVARRFGLTRRREPGAIV
jgi:uncharacterized protein DUF4349